MMPPMSEAPTQYELSACTGKASFDSFSLAKKVAKRRRRSMCGDRKSDAYKCEACGKWHIGYRSQRKRNIHGR